MVVDILGGYYMLFGRLQLRGVQVQLIVFVALREHGIDAGILNNVDVGVGGMGLRVLERRDGVNEVSLKGFDVWLMLRDFRFCHCVSWVSFFQVHGF